MRYGVWLEVMVISGVVFSPSLANNQVCQRGSFGWNCQYRCTCSEDCDKRTGECKGTCPGTSWGPGCLLSSDCTYNDPTERHYVGRKSTGGRGGRCVNWSRYDYRDEEFPEKSKWKSANYCRDPSKSKRTWCFTGFGRQYEWCTLRKCACPRSRFGINCQSECHCSDQQNTCNSATGVCQSGCHNNFKGYTCQECAEGKYGVYCDKSCSGCQGTCNRETGVCASCKSGWHGDRCDKQCPANCEGTCNRDGSRCNSCKKGFYGNTCSSTCPGNCTITGGCYQSSGNCIKCQDGSYGDRCKISCSPNCKTAKCYRRGKCVDGCKGGHFGDHCERECHCTAGSCDRSNGYCLNCITGFHGYSCNQRCPKNCGGRCKKEGGDCETCVSSNFGSHCERTCPKFCNDKCEKNDGRCIGCKPGYHGSFCDARCSKNCAENTCGQTHGDCSGCIPGFYGISCLQNCPENCLRDTCNQSNGKCTECRKGFHGPHCSIACDRNCTNEGCARATGHCINCITGKYGLKCQTECPSGCKGNTCLRGNGMCVACLLGYYGPSCNESCPKTCGEEGCMIGNGTCKRCKTGFYGNQCEHACAPGCWSPCGIDGTCSCKTGYEGPSCDTVSKTKLSPGGKAGAAIGVVLLVLLLAVLLIVFYIRRKRTAEKDQNTANISYHFNAADQKEDQAEDSELYENLNDKNNQTYDSTAIPVDMLPGYVKHINKIQGGFKEEYKSFPNGSSRDCSVGLKKELQDKNRFKNIVPYDDNRILIGSDNNGPLFGYINASYVPSYDQPKEFIATQGPNPSSTKDFIQMLWEYNVPLVVMVTNLKEDKKTKCEKYWPEQRQTLTFGEILVTLNSVNTYPYYVQRKLALVKGNTIRELVQLQFTKWPDHGVPQSASSFLMFHKRANELYDVTRGPTVVHCSAGVGRTGTFLAVDHLLRQAAVEGRVSVYKCVLQLRQHRVNMVQSLDQYKFIHESLLVALHCGTTLYQTSDLEEWDAQDRDQILRDQFQVLEKLSPGFDTEAYSNSHDPANTEKNRDPARVPTNQGRPLLMTPVPNGNDYINAVFVNANEKKDGVLVTQSPMETTMVDFWRLVHDYTCTIIVALNETGIKGFPDYFSSTEENYGPFVVTLKSVAEEDHYIRRWVRFKHKKGEEKHLQQVAVHSDHNDRKLPDPAVYLSLIECVNLIHQADPEGRILIHCRYGFEESGLFCALIQICKKIMNDQEVDVFSAVKKIRTSRPEFIPSLAHYQWLHEAASQYVKSFSTYANFR